MQPHNHANGCIRPSAVMVEVAALVVTHLDWAFARDGGGEESKCCKLIRRKYENQLLKKGQHFPT